MSELVYFDGKVIGEIEGKTFFKNVVRANHQLRQPPAWAIDAGVINKLILLKVQEIVLVVRDEGNQRYTSSLSNFTRHCITLDRKHGKQYALTLNRWTKEDNRQAAMF